MDVNGYADATLRNNAGAGLTTGAEIVFGPSFQGCDRKGSGMFAYGKRALMFHPGRGSQASRPALCRHLLPTMRPGRLKIRMRTGTWLFVKAFREFQSGLVGFVTDAVLGICWA
jgi:hypothetical protein